MNILRVLVALLWFGTGAYSFAYWWTKDFDMTYAQVPIMIGAGVLGPPSYLIGWSIHGDTTTFDNVIFKKRV